MSLNTPCADIHTLLHSIQLDINQWKARNEADLERIQEKFNLLILYCASHKKNEVISNDEPLCRVTKNDQTSSMYELEKSRVTVQSTHFQTQQQTKATFHSERKTK